MELNDFYFWTYNNFKLEKTIINKFKNILKELFLNQFEFNKNTFNFFKDFKNLENFVYFKKISI